MNNLNKRRANKTLPILKECLVQLVDEFEKDGILVLVKDDIKVEKFDNNFNEFKNGYFAFKSLAKKIYNLLINDNDIQNDNIDLHIVFDKLNKTEIYVAEWLKDEAKEYINLKDSVIQDKESGLAIHQYFVKQGVIFYNEINALLEGYSKFEILKNFSKSNLEFTPLKNHLNVSHPLNSNNVIFFSFKASAYREYIPEREHVFQLIEILNSADEKLGTKLSEVVLLSFSSINEEQHEIVQFKFNQLKKQLKIDASMLQRIKLVLLNFYNPIQISKELLSYYKYVSSSNLHYDFIGDLEIKNNHEVLNQFFEIHNKQFNLTIIPRNSDFWRFGFVLSDEKNYSIKKLEGNLNEDKLTTDIHICVGILSEDKDIMWHDNNHLILTEYKAEITEDGFTPYLSYKGEHVKMEIVAMSGTIKVTVFIGTNKIGFKSYKLEKKYIHFVAWCDYRQYHLTLELNIKPINQIFGLDIST